MDDTPDITTINNPDSRMNITKKSAKNVSPHNTKSTRPSLATTSVNGTPIPKLLMPTEDAERTSTEKEKEKEKGLKVSKGRSRPERQKTLVCVFSVLSFVLASQRYV